MPGGEGSAPDPRRWAASPAGIERAGDQLLPTVVSNAPIILWSVDRDGRFTLSQGKGLEPLGLEFGEAVGRSALELYRDYPEILNHLRRALGGEELRETVRLGELYFESWCSPLRNQNGELDGVIGVATDITSCKRAEIALQQLNEELEARVRRRTEQLTRANRVLQEQIQERRRACQELEQSQAKWQSLVENAPDHILTVTRDGVIEFINYTDPTRTREQVIGSSIYDYLPSETHDSVRDVIGSVFDTGRPAALETSVHLADNQRMWIASRIGPVRHDGQVVAATIIARDITPHKQAEEEIKQKREQLTHVARLSTVGEMAAGLAHELNQPLAAISYYSSGCLIRLQSPDANLAEVREALEEITSQAQRAGDVIHRLRQFLQKCEMHCEPVQLDRLVRDALRLAAPEIRRRIIRVHTELAADLPAVLADDLHLVQVLLNLLLNAMDAVQQVAPERHDIWIGTQWEGGHRVRLSVKDCGVGLPAELGDRIFDAFVTTKPHGLGMGLSISRSIITALGGRLWAAANDDGLGTTFHVSLPAFQGSGTA